MAGLMLRLGLVTAIFAAFLGLALLRSGVADRKLEADAASRVVAKPVLLVGSAVTREPAPVDPPAEQTPAAAPPQREEASVAPAIPEPLPAVDTANADPASPQPVLQVSAAVTPESPVVVASADPVPAPVPVAEEAQPAPAVPLVETMMPPPVDPAARATGTEGTTPAKTYDAAGPNDALASLILQLGKDKVRLSGLDGPKANDVCRADGALWACGLEARAALAALVRGKTVVCEAGTRAGKGLISARCSVDGLDLGEAQVAAGWARPLAGAPEQFTQELRVAREGSKGLWRGGWTIRGKEQAVTAQP